MRCAIALSLLAAGCTSLYGGDPPVGCDEEDADGDGFLAEACVGVGTEMADCDDSDPEVFPGAPERCNAFDDDCDDRYDEDLATAAYAPDCDADGVGAADGPLVEVCDPALLGAPACADADRTWVEGAGDCDDGDPARQTSCGECGSIDLLFAIDSDASMAPAQALLAAQLPRVLTAIATGDSDLDGTPDTEPVADLHVGVVTADMGSRGFDYPSCRAADVGDDGLLVTSSAASDPSCERGFPTFLAWDPASDLDALAADAVCIADVGQAGCLFEQPLEAALKALTPSSSLLRFHPGELGHGDFENAGFLRSGSVLAVTVLTDEDDCSVENPELYDPGSTFFDNFPNVRCALYPEFLHPVHRYVSGLRALREASDLVFAFAAGVPPDLVRASPELADYDTIAADMRMLPAVQRVDPTRLEPACSSADGAIEAAPPIRMVEAGRQLTERGVRTAMGSVCDGSLDAMAEALVTHVLAARAARCGG